MSVYRVTFFFFKQKTAYEMRISDWSSDVCSSDLGGLHPAALLRELPAGPPVASGHVGRAHSRVHLLDAGSTVRRRNGHLRYLCLSFHDFWRLSGALRRWRILHEPRHCRRRTLARWSRQDRSPDLGAVRLDLRLLRGQRGDDWLLHHSAHEAHRLSPTRRRRLNSS